MGEVSSSQNRAVWDPEMWRAAQKLLPPPPQTLVLAKDNMFLKTPLLLGLIALGTHVWTIQKEFVDISKNHDYLVTSVELLWLSSVKTTWKNTHTSCWRLGKLRKR